MGKRTERLPESIRGEIATVLHEAYCEDEDDPMDEDEDEACLEIDLEIVTALLDVITGNGYSISKPKPREKVRVYTA